MNQINRVFVTSTVFTDLRIWSLTCFWMFCWQQQFLFLAFFSDKMMLAWWRHFLVAMSTGTRNQWSVWLSQFLSCSFVSFLPLFFLCFAVAAAAARSEKSCWFERGGQAFAKKITSLSGSKRRQYGPACSEGWLCPPLEGGSVGMGKVSRGVHRRSRFPTFLFSVGVLFSLLYSFGM